MKKYGRCKRVLFLCLSLLLMVSLVACKETDEQNSAQPTPSTQPTAAPTPTPPPIPYTDVAVDAPYYDAVAWAYKNGIASDGETFGPADACTRGQVITFLWRAKGSPEPQATESPFSDRDYGLLGAAALRRGMERRGVRWAKTIRLLRQAGPGILNARPSFACQYSILFRIGQRLAQRF